MARIDFQMNFNANKSGLNDIATTLKNIQQQALKAGQLGTLTDELEQASIEAKKLETILNQAWNSKLNQLDLSKVNQSIKTTYGSVSQLKNRLESVGQGRVFNQLQSDLLSTNLQLKQSNKLLDEMATSMANTVKWGITSSIFNNITNQIQKAWTYTKQLDTSLNDIRIVTDKSADSMERFARQANEAAKNLGTSTKDYTDASLIYYQQGLSDEETRARTETTLKAANVTGQASSEVSEQLTAIWNGYKVTAEETELYIDKVAKVAAATAADLEELSTGMSKVASAASTMGVDVDQLNALLATTISVTREAPETVGTSFRTIFARMTQLKSDGTDEFGVTLGRVSAQLESMGIQILDQQGEMRDLGTVITEVGEKWQGWSEAQKVAAAQAMAGTQQYSRLMAVFENWDMYNKALTTSQEAVGTLSEQQDIYMESTEAHLQKLSTEAERTYDILFNQDTVNGFADALTGVLNIFNNFLDVTGGGMASLANIGLMLGNIFNKQIGTGINNVIGNAERNVLNQQNAQSARDIANVQASTQGMSQYEIDAYQKQLDYSEQILELSKNISTEKYNEINALKKALTQDELRVAAIYDYQDALEKNPNYAQDLTKELKTQTGTVNNLKKVYKDLEGTYEEIHNLEKVGLTYKEDEQDMYDYQSKVMNELYTLNEKNLINTKYQADFEQILDDKTSEKLLSKDQIAKTEEIINNILMEQITKEEQLKRLKQAQKDIEDGTITALDAQVKQKEQQLNAEIANEQRNQVIQNSIQGLTAIITLSQQAIGMITTLNDESLSGWEKFEKIASTLPFFLISLASNLQSIIALPASLKATKVALDSTTVSVVGLKMSMWELTLIIGAIIAVIAAIVAIGTALYNDWNKQAEAAKNASLEANNLKENYEALTQAAKDLKKEISDYKEAKAALKELGEDTDEYAEALENANEKAKALIETYGLYDQYEMKDGLISINQDALNNIQLEANKKANDAKATSYAAQINANTQQLKSDSLDFRRSLGIVYSSGMLYTEGTEYAEGQGQDSDGNLVSEKSINTVIEGLKGMEDELSAMSDESLKNAILNIDGLSEAAKLRVDAMVKERDALIDLVEATNKAEKANEYYANQILESIVEKEYGGTAKDIATEDKVLDETVYNQLIAAGAAREEETQKKIQDILSNSSGKIQGIESNADLQNFLKDGGYGDKYSFDWSGDNDKVVALKYAELVKGANPAELTYSEDDWGHGTVTNAQGEKIVDNVDDVTMRRAIARQAELDKITKEQGGELNLDAFYDAAGKLRDTTFGDNMGVDFFNSITNAITNKTTKLDFSALFGELDPTELQNLLAMTPEELKTAFGLTDEQIQALGWDGAQGFHDAFDAALNQYDANAYIENTTQKIADNQDLLNVLSKGDMSDLDDEQIQHLKDVEAEYAILGEIQNKTSHEYLAALRQIKEQQETNVQEALQWEKEKQEAALETQMTELDGLEEQWKGMTDAEREADKLKEDGIYVQLTAKTDEIEETLKKLEDTKYQIKVQVDADLASDVEDAFGIADELTQLQESVSEDLTYTFEEAQELIAKGYGEMFTNAKETSENTIQVNKDVMNSFIDTKQAEIEADRQAKIEQLETQKTYLKTQRDALVQKLNALKEAASAETAVDAATAMEKVQNANVAYEAATNALNEELSDEAEGATENQKINAELYNALSGMYETNVENENQAEADATNNQKANIDKRIENVRALHTAYSSLATQVRESENGKNTKFSAGSTAGGVNNAPSSSKTVESSEQQANEIAIEDLKTKTEDLFNNNRTQYNEIIAALIKSTEDEINAIDAQIGAADAGIAALKSSGKSLDKLQKDAKAGGSGSDKEADIEESIENEKDLYHDVNIELEQISTTLGRLQKQQDKLFGKNLIKNLNAQIETLNDQIETTGEKIKIAEGEAAGLKASLSGQGVTFNADGTIANYAAAYEAQLAYVNSIIAQYNAMDAESQEAYKDTVEQAKANFEKFVDNISSYDTLISETIPGLQDEIQDAINEQIELQIQKFNIEIELRLDLAEAEREWNEFKKRIIDGIDEDDILGNARARLQDFNSYYKADGTGSVQAGTKQVNNILEQLRQIDETGTSSVYGDNKQQALDDLDTYYSQLMSDLNDLADLQEEIHQAYLDMMDEAQEKFDEQLDVYEQISSLIEHDMKLIELVSGEDSYAELAKYYDKQHENNLAQLDFQRQQVDFWKQQMDMAEEGSDEWESAREKWMDAVEDWRSSVEEAVEAIQDKYLNAINLIFQGLNDKVTNGMGLEYVSEEWELINANADQYLDTINAMYGIQSLESKYLDAIDQTDSISAQQKLNDLMQQELSALEEKDKLTQYDIDRANMRYEIALKQIALEEAQQNKSSMRLRRDSQGNYTYQFVSDQDAIGQAQDELSALQNELYNFDLENYRNNLDELYQIWEEYQQKMAEAAQINDPEERAARELLLNEQYGELINGLVEQNATIRVNLNESAFAELADLYNVDVANFQQLSADEQDILMNDMVPQWDSGIQQMADIFAGEGGFVTVCKDAMEELAEVTETYESDLQDVEDAAGITYDTIADGTDDAITQTQDLLANNDELIDSYERELEAIQDIIDEMDTLIAKYKSAEAAAKAATEAAYKYEQEEKRKAAEEAAKENAKNSSNTNTVTTPSSNTGAATVSAGGAGGSGGGDGNLQVGDTATYTGKYYYDSYGTSPAGSRYSGVANGVKIDILNNNPYGAHIRSADGKFPDLGWVKKSQLSGFDTGGYTGNWGDSSGRLALLHQKELVLNASDTANMLSALKILEGIVGTVGSSMLSRLANLGSGIGAPMSDISAASDTLEQNVHIDASFPNVQNSKEIEDAFNNLVNIASQRVYRNKR